MENTINKPQRNSCIEIMRIIAMILIVFGHQIDTYFYDGVGGTIDFQGVFPSSNPVFVLLSFVGPLGLLGDVLFIVCSAYFLLDSNRISVKKIFYLIATDTIIMSLVLIVRAGLGDTISTKQIFEAIFPTVLQVNWFIGYYIVFYLLHPFFNYVIRKLDKKGLAIVTLLLVIQCNIIAFGMGDAPGSLGLKLLCFISIYFVVAYYKLYGGKLWESKKFNVIVLIVSIFTYIAFRIAMNYIGLKVEYVAYRQYGYAHINNPIIVVMAVAMLNLCARKVVHNKVVNYFAGLSLIFYLTHKNVLIFEYIPYIDYFVDTYGASNFVFAIFTKTLIVLGMGLILAILYRHTIYYGVMWLSGKVEIGVMKIVNTVKDKYKAKKLQREQQQNIDEQTENETNSDDSEN